eukprot:CAMPEP_0167779210 /NCGR_PEP_ID=MMETSP0111_2-20121227/4685_1 /TAXON_ID=91324 /ORGANISM="Lotharella globosa, Strain CCCM811" /LENGTH=296 /DNA_ID=CAMNT_0007669605 /DNA_START=657 /DNA_END=1547 /DNA_ORIENTATION=+
MTACARAKRSRDDYYGEWLTGWLKRQTSIQLHYFPVLCNWLVELHFELFPKGERECIGYPTAPVHLAIKYLCRFMKRSSITKAKLQLVGVSCYQVAISQFLTKSHMEKRNLDSKRFAYYTDGAYTAAEVTKTIADLYVFGCVVESPIYTPQMALLEHLGRMPNCPKLIRLLAHYLLDLSMHSIVNFSGYAPSVLALAGLDAAVELASKGDSGLIGYLGRIRSIGRDHFAVGMRGHQYNSAKWELKQTYIEAMKQEVGGNFDVSRIPKQCQIIMHYKEKFIDLITDRRSGYKGRLFT